MSRCAVLGAFATALVLLVPAASAVGRPHIGARPGSSGARIVPIPNAPRNCACVMPIPSFAGPLDPVLLRLRGGHAPVVAAFRAVPRRTALDRARPGVGTNRRG